MADANSSDIMFLSGRDIEECLDMRAAIEAMRLAFRGLSNGTAEMPERARIDVPTPPGTALFMPGYLPETHAIGVKTVTLFEQNPRQGRPLIHGLFCLFDASTGQPMAVLDAARLTAIRTGAASGLATDLLARRDATRVTIFGAGVQGRTQLAAVCQVRPIEAACIYDIDVDRARHFAEEMTEKLDIAVHVAPHAAAAVRTADVICTATVATQPVFDDGDLPDGVHINAVGSYKPGVQEIPAATVARARIVLDCRPAALSEAGDLLEPLRQKLVTEDEFRVELGDLVTGKQAGRETGAQVTLFKSVGFALEDLAAADVAVRNARGRAMGTFIPMN